MRKFLSTLAVILMATATSQAQTTYYQTGFDNGLPDDIATYDLDQRTPSIDMQKLGFEKGMAWIVNKGVDPDDANNYVAISTSWYRNAGQSDDWMVLPALKIADSRAELSFRSMTRDKDFSDGFKVYITEKGNKPTDFTDPAVLSVNEENASWTQHNVSLADYVGKTVYIAFVNDSKDKSALYLDDIFIGQPSHVRFKLNLGKTYDGFGNIPLSVSISAINNDVEGFTINLQGETDGQQVNISKTFTAAEATVKTGNTVTFDSIANVNIPKNKRFDWTATVTSGGDTTNMSGYTWAFPWRVVAEETTGTWCLWCVRGIGAMNWMSENYPNGFIGIAVHCSHSSVPDSMAYDSYINDIHSHMGDAGYPHAMVNRYADSYGDPINIPSIYKAIKQTQTNITGVALTATYDRETNKIHANTDICFADKVSNASYRLAYVVVENNVHRTHAETGILNDYNGYDQINGYAGGTETMYGFEKKPGILNADNMWYQDVARLITPSYEGVKIADKVDLAEGDHLTNSLDFDMPASVLKRENTQLVALLIDGNGEIVNADRVNIIDTADGIGMISQKEASEKNSNAPYYNLNGVRVAHPSHGIYIHNGRKVVL